MAGGSNGHQRAAILDAGTMTRNDPATEMKEAATEAASCSKFAFFFYGLSAGVSAAIFGPLAALS